MDRNFTETANRIKDAMLRKFPDPIAFLRDYESADEERKAEMRARIFPGGISAEKFAQVANEIAVQVSAQVNPVKQAITAPIDERKG